ncbi:MAG: response regulator [Candidatus Eisenbacteria bacterium]
MRVLIAEDDPVNRRLLGRLLPQLGFDTVSVDRGDLALEKIRSEKLQLAVVDWVMPGLSGIDLCRRLESEGRMVYVVVLTGRESHADMLEALEAGASDFLTKPVRSVDLAARLNVGKRVIQVHSRLAERSRVDAVNRLVAGMAHEINTPIQFLGDNLRFLVEETGTLLSFASNLQNTVAGMRAGGKELTPEVRALMSSLALLDLDYLVEEVPRALSESIEGADRVAEIIRELREYDFPVGGSRGTADSPPLERAGLAQVLAPVVSRIRSRIPDGLELEVDVPASLPDVQLHCQSFQEAVRNLLDNAVEGIRTLEDGGGSPHRIRLLAESLPDAVELSVEDDGPGVDSADQERIFDPFFTTKSLGSGPGLGLHSARTIIEDIHGGQIRIDPDYTRGARFLVSLPISRDAMRGVS